MPVDPKLAAKNHVIDINMQYLVSFLRHTFCNYDYSNKRLTRLYKQFYNCKKVSGLSAALQTCCLHLYGIPLQALGLFA
ncbi:MAG TPA: hypothetical protein VHK86_03535, partial [Nitrososphaera sp.]|nr:hypothetical protein [Nitrososphaera sp.]